MKCSEKRGSHVGIIISFNLFILFLLSIFLLINPFLKEKGEKQPVLEFLHQKILKNVSSNMTSTLIKIENGYAPSGKSCIEISGGWWLPGESIVVKNVLNQRIATNSDISLDINWTGDKFLKIYSSLENFETMPLGTSDCAIPTENTNFFIKSIKTEKYIFESNIIKLNTSYANSYEDLKNYLNIPFEEEFGFSFINSEGITKIEVGRIPASVSIYSKESYVAYVDSQSNVLPGIIIVKVW